MSSKGNMFFQLRFGFSAEKFYGTRRYIAIYLLSGLGGNILSAYMMPGTVSIGASSAIFGIIALYGIYIAYNWHQMGEGRDCVLIIYGSMVIYQFIESFFTPTIDLYGHLGGYLVGGFTSLMLLHREESSKKWNALVAACFVAFCLYFAVFFVLLFGIDFNCDSECHPCNGLKYNPNFT
jgi:membrane associated rhomboid family serine protease